MTVGEAYVLLATDEIRLAGAGSPQGHPEAEVRSYRPQVDRATGTRGCTRPPTRATQDLRRSGAR